MCAQKDSNVLMEAVEIVNMQDVHPTLFKYLHILFTSMKCFDDTCIPLNGTCSTCLQQAICPDGTCAPELSMCPLVLKLSHYSNYSKRRQPKPAKLKISFQSSKPLNVRLISENYGKFWRYLTFDSIGKY